MMAVFLFFNDIFQAPAKPRREGRRKSQKIRKAQISSGKSEIFSDLIPTFFRFFRLFSALVVGVGIFNFISFNADFFLPFHQILLIRRLLVRLQVYLYHIRVCKLYRSNSLIDHHEFLPIRDKYRDRNSNLDNISSLDLCTLTEYHSS